MQASFCLLLFAFLAVAQGFADSRRIAVVPAGGEPASSNPAAATVESRLAEGLSAALIGQPGVTMVDRASIDQLIIKEQNRQFNDRFSADAAVRFGKLLGAQQLIVVHVTDAKWSTHPQTSGGKTKTDGTVILAASARLVDVESGTILSQPSSSFEETVAVSETSSSSGFRYGSIAIPARTKSSGGDPNVIADDEWKKAGAAVGSELAAKLTGVVASAPQALAKPISAVVAGIVGGSVYINQGASGGVNAGRKFQISRMVSVGLNDPTTKQPILKKQQVCVLTIVDVQETNASGTCLGGLPQSGDVAESTAP